MTRTTVNATTITTVAAPTPDQLEGIQAVLADDTFAGRPLDGDEKAIIVDGVHVYACPLYYDESEIRESDLTGDGQIRIVEKWVF